MDFIQAEIKRIHRNRMVLFGILALYFLIFIPVTAAGSHGLSYFALVSSPFLLVVVLFAFFFFSSMHSYRRYMKSKTYKNLAQLGMGSAELTGKVISDEVANKLVYLDKRLVMTQNWIVLRYVFTVTIKPLSELIWLYKRMTRTNFGGKFFSIICTFMNKKQYQINVKNENQCDELLMFIINKHPQILAGYSETWFRIYKKNFDEFVHMAKSEESANHDAVSNNS